METRLHQGAFCQIAEVPGPNARGDLVKGRIESASTGLYCCTRSPIKVSVETQLQSPD